MKSFVVWMVAWAITVAAASAQGLVVSLVSPR